MLSSSVRRAVCSAGAFLLASCLTSCSASSDSTAPEQRAASDLQLLTVALDAPPLAVMTKSFYAVRGRNAGMDLWYRPRPGQRDSTKFLEFRMGGATLARRPDGSTIAEGDSVLITVTVTDPTRLIVEFQPSGLVFSSKDPAKLKMFFGQCGDDLNRDGKVDGSDDSLVQRLSIWRRESLVQPWFKVSSAVVKENKEIDAELGGFTGYAIAY